MGSIFFTACFDMAASIASIKRLKGTGLLFPILNTLNGAIVLVDSVTPPLIT
jgi:hypothetical protein